MRILTTRNIKMMKGEAKGYRTAILHLAPADLSGHCVCPHASPGCKSSCLNKTGRGGTPMPTGGRNIVQRARIKKTKMFFADRPAFIRSLKNSIRAFARNSRKNGFIPCIRLNGTSDLPWEKWGVIQAFPGIQMYDYTKGVKRMDDYLDGKMPPNYHLTFSRSELNDADCARLSARGANVAVVFDTKRGKSLPKMHYGVRVVDGDKNDLRFLDGKGVVVGLRFKHFFKDTSDHNGFIIKVS